MSLHPAYFTTRFRVDQPEPAWPDAFVIVTGYATTGEQWPDELNEQADQALRLRLEALGVWHQRITGYDSATGHAEPGYAAALSVEDGLTVGRAFRQDAIFAVDTGQLRVVSCGGQQRADLGPFDERLDK
jgi:hypothetical protein